MNQTCALAVNEANHILGCINKSSRRICSMIMVGTESNLDQGVICCLAKWTITDHKSRTVSYLLDYSGPWILCIPDSKTLRADLESPLVLSARGSRGGDSTNSLGSLFRCLTTLSAKQPQFPQLLLIRLVFQTLHQLRCPSLDTLQHLNVFLLVRGPKPNTVFEMRPHQCQAQGDSHFPNPTGHTISHASQDAVGLLGHLGTLLAHIQPAVDQHPQVLFCEAAFQPLFPKPVALHGLAVTQVQDLALGLVEPHTIGLGPLIQPVQIPLQSLPTLQQINTPAQFGVVCKFTEGTFNPLIQIIEKDIKQNWPQH
ncbi:hypothetical protein QYF61_022226 [Mycteria americana]|uniref:Uncharacterized protein n=1 Tax=Mycteria americana TaxID=33587 RepID=A0AAN7Q7K6_MYCAM|nr:hypothetical protein QYF61_022226 [Mycteria americana]